MFDGTRYVKDFEKAWNEKDAEGFVTRHYDANVEYLDPSGNRGRGRDGLRKITQDWFSAFSDMRIEPVRSIQSGNDVALLYRCTARHTGELEVAPGERVPATNRDATVDVAEFMRVDERGRIVEDLVTFDNARLLMQLGLLPAAGQPEARRTIQR